MGRIAHISDLHFGAHDPAIAEALVAAIAAAQVDLVVASGDFTQRATHDEFDAARAFMERLPAPRLVVPGNHDVPLNLLSRLFRPLAAYERWLAPVGVTGFADDAMVVAGLATPRRFTGKNGRISREQVAALPGLLSGGGEGVVRILVTHHPLALPDGGEGLALAFRAGKVRDAILAAGTHMLLSGHYHQSAHGEAEPHLEGGGRLLVVHAGTAVSVRRRNEGNYFNLIDIQPAHAEIAVMGFSPGGFASERCSRFDRRNGRWRAV